jgi:hypothetical protein
MCYGDGMRSFGQGISPQAALWVSMHEAARAAEALERARRVLDDREVEALATRHAEARRARRQATRSTSVAVQSAR